MTPTTAPLVRPFPWADLPRVSARDAAAAARVRAALRDRVDTARISAALRELVRVDVGVRLAAATSARLGASAVALLLAAAGDDRPSARVLLAVEGALASSLVARALGGKAPVVLDEARTPSPALTGAVAAVVASLARRIAAERPLVVVAAGPEPELARDHAARLEAPVTVTFLVTLDGETFRAAVTVDAAAAAPSSRPRGLVDVPVRLPVVAAITVAERGDVVRLAPGDVLVPRPATLRPASEAPGSPVHGAVVLVAARAERGIRADLAADGRLVVRRHDVPSSWDPPETRMADPRPQEQAPVSEATLTSLEDAPVVVRVELGVVEMTAGAFAALEPGDVIALGRRVGDPASIRVGGVELAQGELVVVDGEVGVRITERTRGT